MAGNLETQATCQRRGVRVPRHNYLNLQKELKGMLDA